MQKLDLSEFELYVPVRASKFMVSVSAATGTITFNEPLYQKLKELGDAISMMMSKDGHIILLDPFGTKESQITISTKRMIKDIIFTRLLAN